jgi:hypothetical protein
MKALELLGFRTKDAQILRDTKRGGYRIAFSRLKNKGNAEEVASDLQRMSFGPSSKWRSSRPTLLRPSAPSAIIMFVGGGLVIRGQGFIPR